MTASGVVVFDMDGVLVDVTESYREAIRRTVQRFTGRLVGNEVIQTLKNQGGWNNDWRVSHRIIADLGVAADYDDVVAYFQSVFIDGGPDALINRERWVARPGVLESLNRRYRLAIFTGRLREEADYTLSRFAPALRFDPMICHDDVVRHKPEPEGLLKIAAAVPGLRLFYVGDTVDDMGSAQAAGVPFIGVASPSAPRYEEAAALFREGGAAGIIADINELEAMLERIERPAPAGPPA